MSTHALADAVIVLHLAFIVFVVLGALPALRWRWWPWVHLPAAAWGAALELFGLRCPLTTLEAWLRRRGGAPHGEEGVVERFVVPLVYPGELTREIQVGLGVLVILVNAGIYLVVRRRRRAGAGSGSA